MRKVSEEKQYNFRFTDPTYLPTVSMNELYETVYHSKPPIIERLLH